MPDDNDEILTMEILSVLRCEIKKVMGSGNGEVVIRIYNHKIRRIGTTKWIEFDGGNTKPLE